MDEHELGLITYFVDHDTRILHAERRDSLSKRKIYAEWETMQKVDGFDPAYDTIVDYSLVTSVDLDVADLKELNGDMPNHDPRTGNVAIISGLEYSRFLLARFFCKLANLVAGRKHQVFQSKDEAVVWLFSLREPG